MFMPVKVSFRVKETNHSYSYYFNNYLFDIFLVSPLPPPLHDCPGMLKQLKGKKRPHKGYTTVRLYLKPRSNRQ